jgi:hypothetical protein
MNSRRFNRSNGIGSPGQFWGSISHQHGSSQGFAAARYCDPANVRYGSQADIPVAPAHVRFTPESRHGDCVIYEYTP